MNQAFRSGLSSTGSILSISSNCITAELPLACLGSWFEISGDHNQKILAQVVAIKNEYAQLVPTSSTRGLRAGDRLAPIGNTPLLPLPKNNGQKLNALLSCKENISVEAQTIRQELQLPHSEIISTQILSGIPVLDAFFSLGYGQKVGIFSPPGAGKTTLLFKFAESNQFTRTILALVGERSREVSECQEFVNNSDRKSSITIIAATSAEPAVMRKTLAYSAMALAQYWSRQGEHVLIIFDSLTRWCRAVREVGLSSGEQLLQQGLTISILEELPVILECCGNFGQGSITGVFSVLTNQTTLGDMLSDEILSLLDGHIYLDPKIQTLASSPRIKWSLSCSRLWNKFHPSSFSRIAGEIRQLIHSSQEIQELKTFLGSELKDSNSSYVSKIEHELYQLFETLIKRGYNLSELREEVLLFYQNKIAKCN